MWIGLFWNSTDLSFKWVDNETLGSWSNWYTDEPNCMELAEMQPTYCLDDYHQNCIRITLEANSWLWKTHECYMQHSVLCQSCTGSYL